MRRLVLCVMSAAVCGTHMYEQAHVQILISLTLGPRTLCLSVAVRVLGVVPCLLSSDATGHALTISLFSYASSSLAPAPPLRCEILQLH
jgi:hypothetical protein